MRGHSPNFLLVEDYENIAVKWQFFQSYVKKINSLNSTQFDAFTGVQISVVFIHDKNIQCYAKKQTLLVARYNCFSSLLEPTLGTKNTTCGFIHCVAF